LTDSAIRFVVEAYIAAASSPNGINYPLPIRNELGSVRVSEDMDRDNFGEVTLTLDWLDEATINALDPRTINMNLPGPVRFWVRQYDLNSPEPVSYLPSLQTLTEPGYLYPRVIDRDYVSRTVTLTLTTGELFLDEKIRLAAGAIDTGRTSVGALVDYALSQVFASPVSSHASIVNSTAIPIGDRRNLYSRDSFMDLIRSELDSINCRLYDLWGFLFRAEDRDTVAGDPVALSTSGELSGDPIVYTLHEVRTRDGRWADGVAVVFDMTDAGGTITAQFAGTGTSTKGIVISRDRPAPSGNAAANIRARSMVRGKDLQVTARARLDVRTRRNVTVYTKAGSATGMIRGVEYTFPEGEMQLRVQS